MLVQMDFGQLRTLGSQELSWKCVEPFLQQVRGKSYEVKKELMQQLNPAQSALSMFYAYHNHIGSAAELYWFTQYYMTDLQAWPLIKEGVQFFGDLEMMEVLNRAERAVTSRNLLQDGSWREAKPSDLEQDEELSNAIQGIYEQYTAAADVSIQRMNIYVSQHLNEFIELV